MLWGSDSKQLNFENNFQKGKNCLLKAHIIISFESETQKGTDTCQPFKTHQIKRHRSNSNVIIPIFKDLHSKIIPYCYLGADKKSSNELYYKYDLAFITLTKRFKTAIPICIENEFSKSFKNKVVTSSGWDDMSKKVPKKLLYQKLRITDEITCKSCESSPYAKIMDQLKLCKKEVRCLRAQDPKYHLCINRVETRSLNSKRVSLDFHQY